jgi:hypothetical protein
MSSGLQNLEAKWFDKNLDTHVASCAMVSP